MKNVVTRQFFHRFLVTQNDIETANFLSMMDMFKMLKRRLIYIEMSLNFIIICFKMSIENMLKRQFCVLKTDIIFSCIGKIFF